jgi:hypothetical protein
MSTEGEPLARAEIESQDTSSAVEKAYQLFNERPELRILEVWQDGFMVLKLERQRT